MSVPALKGIELALDTINKILQITIMRPDLLDKVLGPQQATLDAYVAALKDAPPPKESQ